MAIKFHVTQDNTALVLTATHKQVQNGLNAIGLKAVAHAKRNCPVDTGRLRNSLTFASETRSGGANADPGVKASSGDVALRGKPESNAVYIGTNVEYAPAVEYLDRYHKSGGAHFIKNAATNHGDEYKATMEAALKA